MGSKGFAGFLSNYEVFQFFQEASNKNAEKKDSTRLHKQVNQSLSTLTYQTVNFLQKSPCAVQNQQAIFSFVQRIKPYNLTKSEQLVMINTRPTLPVDVQAIVEESEERLTEEQINEILDIIEESLPDPAISESNVQGITDTNNIH